MEEEDLNGGQPQWKTALMEEDLNRRTVDHFYLTKLSEPGTACPSLLQYSLVIFVNIPYFPGDTDMEFKIREY